MCKEKQISLQIEKLGYLCNCFILFFYAILFIAFYVYLLF